MAANRGQVFVIVGAAIAVGASLWHATSVSREKRQVAAAFQDATQQLHQLQDERDSLAKELTGANEALAGYEVIKDELQRLKGELVKTQQEMVQLRVEYDDLADTNRSLASELESTTLQKQQLEAKLSDLHELKLAIRQVRHQMREERQMARLEYISQQRSLDQLALETGNRGFLVRDGRPTLVSGSRVQVRVLEPQTAQK